MSEPVEPLPEDDDSAEVDAFAPRSVLWVPGGTYKAGQMVVYNDVVYLFNADTTSGGSFDYTAVTALSAGREMGYIERNTDFVTTNTSPWDPVLGKIDGFAVPVIGEGRPVDVRFQCISITSPDVDKYCLAWFITNGAVTPRTDTGVSSTPESTVGRQCTMTMRVVLAAGVPFTFEVGVATEAGETLTVDGGNLSGNDHFPMHLSVVGR